MPTGAEKVGAALASVAIGFGSSRLASCRPQKTPRSPPSWVFGAVWSVLYAAQGASALDNPLFFGILAMEFAWPFLYCESKKASRWALAPIAALSLAALPSKQPLVRWTAAATAAWLSLAITL